jgi:hypothetical protein
MIGTALQPTTTTSIAEVGRGLRFNLGKEELRFRSDRARLQLMGCTLHYMLPRDLGQEARLRSRGRVA